MSNEQFSAKADIFFLLYIEYAIQVLPRLPDEVWCS
jgi:hypothetical protein